MSSLLQEFVDEVEAERARCGSNGRLYILHNKDAVAAAELHIRKYLEGIKRGGQSSRGHRWQNVPPGKLSQSARAVAARRRRAERKEK